MVNEIDAFIYCFFLLLSYVAAVGIPCEPLRPTQSLMEQLI